ncbi:cell envelope integrity protein TolA [Pseudomonas sp. C27(2019)]|uniref:cell envelope integrity protein TolA n=1 Tax=Pseudomonas sp. C27(2019) TaxID=2604941 RepID=UPI001247C084|nr:cell envelope integrity protein TolA [Pseudomonas sp. C27(2019)]QEY59349.1 cell envelope integrity protein TolA [Pseudomonas sp. C27(2019)]
MRQHDRSPSEKIFWPVVWAVGLHAVLFAFLFVSFAHTPDLPPARPVIKATLYQLQSQSQATTQTNQKIAGEAAKTSAPRYEVEQLEQKKLEQERLAALADKAAKAQADAAARAAQSRKEAEQKAAEAQKKVQASKEEQAKKEAEKLKQAEAAKLKAAEDAKKKAAEDAKKKAADAAKQKAAEEAKKKAAAEAAKKKAADEAKKKAEADKKKRAAEEAAKQRKAQEAARKAAEDKKAGALAELLSEDTQYQQAVADTQGSQVAGSLDDLIIRLVSEQWVRPPSARNGMAVTVVIEMLPDGTITNASVTQSSGDPAFDASAVAAVRNVGRIREMQQLDSKTFNALYRSRRAVFKPEDLSL